MTTRTKAAPQRKAYGIFTFTALYAGWLGKNDDPRHSITPDLHPEKANSLAASYTFLLAISLLICVLLAVEYRVINNKATGVLLGGLLLCAASCAYVSFTNRPMLPTLVMAGYVHWMCFYFLWTGITNADNILYYIWIVPLAVGCLSIRLGSILSLTFIGMMTLLFLPPVFELMGADLDAGFRFRFILALICIYLIAGMAEYYLRTMLKSIFAINRELEQYSLTDSLTGQGNRRNFINQLQRLHAQQLRSGEPFTMIMADIDYFKKVNDSYGHMVGDEVLVFIADILSRTLRDQDALYRWGGEEFMALLPGTGLEQGKVVAERMRKAVESATFTKGNLSVSLTASFGVYAVKTAQPIHEHIKNTDTMMYLAKAWGRNRVVAADEGSGMVLTMK